MKDEEIPIWYRFVATTAGTVALAPSFALWCYRRAANELAELDLTATLWCSRRTPRWAWRLGSRLGDGWLYAFAFLWLREMGERAQANKVAAAVLIAWGMGSALKVLIGRKRQRPLVVNTSRRGMRIFRLLHSLSFPSQHAGVAVAFAVAMWPNPAAAALALYVCVSRVLIGAHYLGDVLAGIAVGVLAGRLA